MKTSQVAAARTPAPLRSVGLLLAITAVIGVASVLWGAAADPADAVLPHAQRLSGYEIITARTEPSLYDVQSESAKCSRGKKVLGGGASVIGSPGAVVFWNGPARGGGTGSWAGAAQEMATTSGRWSLEVYAICAYAGAVGGRT
jgi:hypothetical protein